MRNLTLVILLITTISACRKARCISELQNEISKDIHFRGVNCSRPGVGDESFEWKFNSEKSYRAYECTPSNIPFNLDFNGIIIAQGIRVPYLGITPEGNGAPGYELGTELLKL